MASSVQPSHQWREWRRRDQREHNGDNGRYAAMHGYEQRPSFTHPDFIDSEGFEYVIQHRGEYSSTLTVRRPSDKTWAPLHRRSGRYALFTNIKQRRNGISAAYFDRTYIGVAPMNRRTAMIIGRLEEIVEKDR